MSLVNSFPGGNGGNSVEPYTSNPAMNGTASAGSSDNYSRGDHVHPSDSTKLSTSGDGSNVTATFTAASSRANISTGEKLSVIFGKIAKFFADLKTVAFSGSYNDLSNKLTAGTNIAISNANVISSTSTYTMRYLTSEQVVGTWIDGKPIYQKTTHFSSAKTVNSNNTLVISLSELGVTNPKALIDSKIYYMVTGTAFQKHVARCDFIGSDFRVKPYENIQITDITLQYTKTTD